MEFFNEISEPTAFYGPAQAPHQFLVIVQVVPGIEAGAEDFVDLLQVIEIRACEMPAGVTRTVFIERAQIVAVLRVADAAEALVTPAGAIERCCFTVSDLRSL